MEVDTILTGGKNLVAVGTALQAELVDMEGTSPTTGRKETTMPASYHPSNLRLIDYPGWRVKMVARVAWLLGVLVHIQGIPFGRFSAAEHREAEGVD